MGTRGSVGIIQNKEYKASYNHFDSYPDGLGQDVVNFVNKVTKEKGWDKFKEQTKKVKLVDEHTSKPSAVDKELYKEFFNGNVSDQSLDDWHCLLRNVQGAATFEEIHNKSLFHMIDGRNFIKDSLFCEYAYIINLDDMTLEFYEGFQRKPQEGNKFGTEKDDGYYPCKLVGVCSLENVPEDWQNQFYRA